MAFGKTTIMKIIQNLMNYNFSELIKYDFESIDVEILAENRKALKYTLKSEDLLPSNEELKNIIINSDSFLEELSEEWDIYMDLITDGEILENYMICDEDLTDAEKIEVLREFDRDAALNEVYYGNCCVLTLELLEDIISRDEFKNIVRKIIKKEKFDDEYFNNYINSIKYDDRYGYDFKNSSYRSHTVWRFNDVKESFENIIDIIRKYVENMLESNVEMNIVSRKKIEKIIHTLTNDMNKSVDILDMTKVYSFSNQILPSSLLTNKLIEWKAIAPYNYHFIDDLELNIYNTLLEEWDYECFFEDSSKDISELNNSVIEINSIIKHYFYNIDFVENTNRKALEYYVAFKNNNIFTSNQICDYIVVKDIFLKYIRPIILKNSPFDTDWTAYVFQSHSQDAYTSVFYDFCKKLSNKYQENINPKMKTLQELLNKYMMNKDVEVTPMGLLVRSKDDNRVIPLNSLSSGEKKLLIIFLHCLFNEDVPILIDEPEISLSIIWQENLLPDLLEKTNIKQVIVATHSSAIISDSSLDKYIMPLPNSSVGGGEHPNE